VLHRRTTAPAVVLLVHGRSWAPISCRQS
jgi:hypothetical protein